MATRLYLVPTVGTGSSRMDALRPKYFHNLRETLTISYSTLRFGFERVELVAAELDAATHVAIEANADVNALPENLDLPLGAQLSAVRARMEALGIPFGWASSVDTYRKVVRVVARLFLFIKRFWAIHGPVRLFGSGVTLDTRFNQLPIGVRQDLRAAAESLNYNTSSLTGASTIRDILKVMADQWTGGPIKLGGLEL